MCHVSKHLLCNVVLKKENNKENHDRLALVLLEAQTV